MLCPACQNPVQENAPACLHCGFTLAALDRIFGIPPVLAEEVCDLTQSFSSRERRRMELAIERFELQFPQTRVMILTCLPPEGVPLAGYTYWLFNRNQVVSAMEKGGNNRLVMLAIDPASNHAACMIGYGLEPFISTAAVHESLAAAQVHLAAKDYSQASSLFLKELATRFSQICNGIPQTFGLEGEPLESIDQLDDRPVPAALAY